ncbi:MAG: hypothetical protein HY541_05075 [Deltaproteobacteria bacterium]|nr:hypothetical protein [Deltaproteobacteria bacterium]
MITIMKKMQKIVPFLLIALAVQFSYAFLCHSPGENKTCLMNCCKKPHHCADESGQKPEDCCLYRDSASQNFLVSKVLPLSFFDMEAPLPVHLPLVFQSASVVNVEREFVRYGPSPPLYILKQSFLL